MGQIAEDMLDGSCCSLCGQYFEHPKGGIYVHGYPVVCDDCYDENCGYSKAEANTF
jgi:ribosomal protein S27E